MSRTPSVIFHNPGTLDTRAFRIMGLSAKQGDNPIGFFGTGLKYAIAVLLRTGHTIAIETGGHVYDFVQIDGQFRDKQMSFIYYTIDGGEVIELPFTTHLGTNWEVWQAYRELYTNAKDEGGGVCVTDAERAKLHDYTYITINGEPILAVANDHSKYFIDVTDRIPLHNPDAPRVLAAVYMRRETDDNTIYYRGMHAGMRVEKPLLLTYNMIRDSSLTEDRTFRSEWAVQGAVTFAWRYTMSKETLIEYIPQLTSEYAESAFFNRTDVVSEDFLEAVRALKAAHRIIPLWAVLLYDNNRPTDEVIEQYTPTSYERRMIEKALTILDYHGTKIEYDDIKHALSLPNNVMGMCYKEAIYLAHDAVKKGTTYIVSTLYEEWLHLEKNMIDEDRSMQNHLMNEIANLFVQVHDMQTHEGGK